MPLLDRGALAPALMRIAAESKASVALARALLEQELNPRERNFVTVLIRNGRGLEVAANTLLMELRNSA